MSWHRRKFLCVTAGGLSAAAFWRRDVGSLPRSRVSWALGSETRITVWHEDENRAEEALDAAFAAVEEVEEVMSLYRPQSQVCRLNAEGELRDPHPDLVRVLEVAQEVSRRSDGAFDVTVQPLWARRASGGSGPVPVGWRDLLMSREVVKFRKRGMAVTLNGIAQGFAADRVRAVMEEHGIGHALIDTGEVAGIGERRPGEGPWRIGVQHPREAGTYLCLAGLRDRCLATSGDYATTWTEDYSEHHLIDPRTGWSPRELSSVSVAAESAMEADALSTAAFVLGVERGMDLIASYPGADAMMTRKADGEVLVTRGFPRLPTV